MPNLRCTEPGCRKLQGRDGEFCPEHGHKSKDRGKLLAIRRVLKRHSSWASSGNPELRDWIGNETVGIVAQEILEALNALEEE